MLRANELRKYIIEVNKKSDSFIKENNELRQKINELSIKISKFMKVLEETFSVREEGKNEVSNSLKMFDIREDGKNQ